MINYHYSNETGILLTVTEGSISVDDIINHYNTLLKSEYLTKKLKVLIDCRNTKINCRPSQVENTTKHVKKVLQKFDRLEEAIVVDLPYETAIATLFKNVNSGYSNYHIKIFVTPEAAMNWLNEPILSEYAEDLPSQ
ncbi:MAG: STAS/SEC14 domain-containing protein [Bacteroidales bacterium]|nr:STAS/SEC14 domain-containing protein [Bacteroidales bacterium]